MFSGTSEILEKYSQREKKRDLFHETKKPTHGNENNNYEYVFNQALCFGSGGFEGASGHRVNQSPNRKNIGSRAEMESMGLR